MRVKRNTVCFETIGFVVRCSCRPSRRWLHVSRKHAHCAACYLVKLMDCGESMMTSMKLGHAGLLPTLHSFYYIVSQQSTRIPHRHRTHRCATTSRPLRALPPFMRKDQTSERSWSISLPEPWMMVTYGSSRSELARRQGRGCSGTGMKLVEMGGRLYRYWRGAARCRGWCWIVCCSLAG
jgi:hypothetical protein